jgi:6-phosphogluconolactonase (cycloisomerase 2 family)
MRIRRRNSLYCSERSRSDDESTEYYDSERSESIDEYCDSARSKYSDESWFENDTSYREKSTRHRRAQKKGRVRNVKWTLIILFVAFPALFFAAFGLMYQMNPEAAKVAWAMISDIFQPHSNAIDGNNVPSMQPSDSIGTVKDSAVPTSPASRQNQSTSPSNSPTSVPTISSLSLMPSFETSLQPSRSNSPTQNNAIIMIASTNPSKMYSKSIAPSRKVSTSPSSSPSVSMVPSKESEKEWKMSLWDQIANTIMGQSNYDYTGYSISLSGGGHCIAIGSPSSRTNGYVRVFKINESGAWEQYGNIVNGTNIQRRSGRSVDISYNCDTLVIGSIALYGAEFDMTGSISVYRIEDDEWQQFGNDIVGERNDRTGESVALSSSGTRLVVPAYGSDEGGTVRVFDVSEFDNNDGSFVQVGQHIGAGTDTNTDRFGISISLASFFGDILAIGSDMGVVSGPDGSNSQTGYVKVFTLIEGQWTQLGDTIAGIQQFEFCGKSVSLSYDGYSLAVGSHKYDNGSGLVRVFRFEDGSWVQRGDNIVGMTDVAFVGSSTSLSNNGETLAIRTLDSIEGYVQVYEIAEEQWKQVGNTLSNILRTDDSTARGYFGAAISLSGDGTMLAASDPYHDISSGLVNVYELGAISYPSTSPSISNTSTE